MCASVRLAKDQRAAVTLEKMEAHMCATIVCLALLACAMRPAAAGNSTLAVGPRKVSLSDIVAAMPADLDHMDVARASRIWRKVRARHAGEEGFEQCVVWGMPWNLHARRPTNHPSPRR